jgi:hypothetical protein
VVPALTAKCLPQEKEGTYLFNGKFVSTRNPIDKFGEPVIIACHMMLLKEVGRAGSLDYLQVFEIDGEGLWFDLSRLLSAGAKGLKRQRQRAETLFRQQLLGFTVTSERAAHSEPFCCNILKPLVS